ncbi:MAG: alginate lyase family protein [Tannerella sp.]|jgi:hypothetical protein|nr:alginate lyase family protein [Tannerella sp.]
MNKKVMKMAGSGLLALAIAFLFACGKEDEQPDNPGTTGGVKSITHPCMLHTEADFAFVKSKVQAGEQPWANAFAHLEANKHAQSSWQASPVKKLARLDAGNWATIDRWIREGIEEDWYNGIHSNYTQLMYDAASAYALAVRWKISGNSAYAATGVKILNDWAKTCTGYIVNKSGALIDPNENLMAIQVYQLANAAEILRDFSGWSSADFEAYKKWIADVFYKHASSFLQAKSGCAMHYWLNWDLAQMTAILSIGILTDDEYKINEAIKYFQRGLGTGNINNAVPFVHQDPDSNELLGQSNESGRDQGHATLCVSLMGAFCQMAKNIGEDLFIHDNARALAMCEYTAKYNIGTTENNNMAVNFKYEVPFTPYTNCEYSHPAISNSGRGTVRPAWELILRLASDYGKSAIYSQEWVTLMRQNAARGNSDGGQGDYGSNSGGYDQLGFGTLMFAK